MWPGEAERNERCSYTGKKYGFHSCFFAVDGTTHPLAEKPSFDEETYFDRKSRYSIHALVACDFRKKVISLIVGWPGSVHDARVLKTADFFISDNLTEGGSQYFSGKQHGLGDAAFGPTRRLVPTYKSPQTDYSENVSFNKIHASLRIRIEHVNGLVKCRFQGVREVRVSLRRKSDMERAVKFVTSAYVLHNILVDITDEFWEYNTFQTSATTDTGLGYDSGCEEDDHVSFNCNETDTGAFLGNISRNKSFRIMKSHFEVR